MALAACLLMATHSALDSLELREKSARLQDDARRAEAARRDIIARLPPTPVPLETLRVVHERSLQLEQRSAAPAGLLQPLGAVLERYPQVELDRLDWKLGSAGMPAADGLTPVEAQLLVQARLPSEYGAQQRRALELVDALALDLGRAADGLQVKVTRPPFDLESGQVLRGGARSDRSDADSTPQFALLISRGLAP